MEYCKNIQELHQEDVAIAGGKGASLGELLKAGLAVPPGFVVLTRAFDKFLEQNKLDIKISIALSGVDIKNIKTFEKVSMEIQSLIESANLPVEIVQEISQYFQQLDNKFVAIRSSATSEDGSSAAWAGQLNSYLNTTEKELTKNIKNCWTSLFTPRAIFYRLEKGLAKNKISVAVVVQKMIQAEISGVAFSVHPVTQNHKHMIIEAAPGLGEAMVSGTITPDAYVIDKRSLDIIEITLATKNQILDKAEIFNLARLVNKIEQHYGFPCDIEWAKEGGQFYILQSRAITTLK
jgi:pyruvate,water dikinase